MTRIEISAAAKSFGAQRILDGVELVVADGAVAAILGASGSGKTTLLRLIAGFDYLDRGVIRIGGKVLDDGRRRVHAQHRGIGYVAQDGALFPHLTVAGNVGFGLPRAERARVGELIGMVGLSGLEGRHPHQLSGGQQQRVALARALAIRPAVLLLDEPFASLDASLRSSVRRDVSRVLAEAGTTAILVTHDQDEALSMADHVAVLADGRLLGSGPPRELYEDPADPRVATRLGEANLFPVDLRDGEARCVLGAVSVRGLDAGAPRPGALVLVRPEQVVVHDGPVPGSIPARVESFEYYGHDAIARLALRGEDAPVIARVTGARALRPGESVWLTVTGDVPIVNGSSELPVTR